MDPMAVDIEARAFAAWPAEETLPLGPWRLRANRGVTRRANSVWPGAGLTGAASLGPLSAALDTVEAFYAARGLPAMFQLSPLSSPANLDQALAERGYVHEVPVSVEVARADQVAGAPPPDGRRRLRVIVEPQVFPAWFELSGRRGRFADAPEIYQAMLARLAGRSVHALAELAGEPAAAALAVKDGPWLGIFSMATAPAFRRQGAARAILSALAAHALSSGTPNLYLQVDADNSPARTLYTNAGFTAAYAYHYRRKP
jgi:GNAT superfamily N-acetyltransferase